MSDDAMETFPRDNGVISAGRIVTQFFDASSSGQIEKDPTTYSISGQSGGNSARAANAAELRLRRLPAGSFSHPVYGVSLGVRSGEERLTEIVSVLTGQDTSRVRKILRRGLGSNIRILKDCGR
mgnify:CR=1 FL=1